MIIIAVAAAVHTGADAWYVAVGVVIVSGHGVTVKMHSCVRRISIRSPTSISINITTIAIVTLPIIIIITTIPHSRPPRPIASNSERERRRGMSTFPSSPTLLLTDTSGTDDIDGVP